VAVGTVAVVAVVAVVAWVVVTVALPAWTVGCCLPLLQGTRERHDLAAWAGRRSFAKECPRSPPSERQEWPKRYSSRAVSPVKEGGGGPPR
jgi:hypothetical protein